MSDVSQGLIVVLTGAGIFRELGLHTFRGAEAVRATARIEDMATVGAFCRDSDRVHAGCNARRQPLRDPSVRSDAAHAALVWLERKWPVDVCAITQSTDGLHEWAGSRALLQIHGEVPNGCCAACGAVTAWADNLSVHLVCDSSEEVGVMRPNVVCFGEMQLERDRIHDGLAECASFLSLGRAQSVELTLGLSEGHCLFAEAVPGPAVTVIPAHMDRPLTDRMLG